ncbi:hypothetical protein MMPV_007767 [Pyropia vietnamensis]
MSPSSNGTGRTSLTLTALLALPELRLLTSSPVIVDWLGPLCIAPALVGDPVTVSNGGASAVQVTPEMLRMAVVQDCMCRLALPPGPTAAAGPPPLPPPTPPLPSKPSPLMVATMTTDTSGSAPTLSDVVSTAVDSAGLPVADLGEATVDSGSTVGTLLSGDWEAGASLGVDWEAGALPSVGWDVGDSPADSSSGSELLCVPPEPALPTRSNATVLPVPDCAAGVTGATGPPEAPPSLPPPSLSSSTPPPLPRIEDDGSGLGPVVAASSGLHVPIFSKDRVVCGITYHDPVVDHLGELPGDFFNTPTSRFALDTTTNLICTAATDGTRALVTSFGLDFGKVLGRSGCDEEKKASECCAMSWMRPREPGGDVLVLSRVSVVMNALGDNAAVATSPLLFPQPVSTPTVDPDVEDLRRCFVSALTALEGTYGGAMAPMQGVHDDGAGPDTPVLQVVTSTVHSSWVVAHRLRVTALSSAGGIHPASLVLPTGCGGNRLGSQRRVEVDRRPRRRLLPPPLAPRPDGLPHPPSSLLAGGGGGRGGRGGGKRTRLPIDIDTVTDAVVRARVLRNRESARVSNARRKARAAAARAARQAEAGQGGDTTGGVAVVGEAAGAAVGTPPGVPFVPMPARLLGGNDER